MQIQIDERLRTHIPKLREDEYNQLEENLRTHGCLTPLIVWGDILLDGHNRYDICIRHDIPFRIETIDLPDFEAATAWIEDNQLGRRNLTADQFAYYIGRKYERLKKAEGGRGDRDFSGDQNDHPKTSEIIAEQHGISAPTVRRAAAFARDVDEIANTFGDETRSRILSGEDKLTRKDVAEIAEIAAETVAKAAPERQVMTAAEILKEANRIRAERAEAKRACRRVTVGAQPSDETCTITDLEDLAASGRRFGCIYADPPWLYDNQATRAATSNHYDGLTVEQLCALPVRQLAADDAHLHLWITNAFLFDAPRIFAAWGFKFRGTFIWDKELMGLGNYWRNSHEIMLTAVRGDATRFNDRSMPSVLSCKRSDHSAKPEQVRSMIERASCGPYLELFGRLPAQGWTVWGNQIERNLFSVAAE